MTEGECMHQHEEHEVAVSYDHRSSVCPITWSCMHDQMRSLIYPLSTCIQGRCCTGGCPAELSESNASQSPHSQHHQARTSQNWTQGHIFVHWYAPGVWFRDIEAASSLIEREDFIAQQCLLICCQCMLEMRFLCL